MLYMQGFHYFLRIGEIFLCFLCWFKKSSSVSEPFKISNEFHPSSISFPMELFNKIPITHNFLKQH